MSGNILGGNFPGGTLMGGNFPGGDFFGGNFSRTHRHIYMKENKPVSLAYRFKKSENITLQHNLSVH